MEAPASKPNTAERNVGVIVAFLMALGGVAYVGGGRQPAKPGAAAKPEIRAESDSSGASMQSAECALDVPCVAADYFDSTAADPNAVWGDRCQRMQHLIALVPDPVAAHIGFQFDPTIEAIQRAAEASHYSFDRFALPWDEGSAKKAACLDGATGAKGPCGTRSTYESLPGVLLFRKATAGADVAQSSDGALAVYLVGETPTGGVHKRALNWALSRIAACKDDSIAILGPTFSGSTRSLAIALQEWWRQSGDWPARNLAWRAARSWRVDSTAEQKTQQESAAARNPIRLISGTATALPVAELRAVGTAEDGADVVSFSATVLPDALVFRHFMHYLYSELGVQPADVALLVEANSAYGRALEELGHKSQSSDDSDGVLTLIFPMHIAEARSAVEKTAPSSEQAAIPGGARPALSLALDDDRLPLDLPPQMHPNIARPAAEFGLANLLATISRNEKKFVGLFASDTRDKVFLAKQVHKYCPDVRLFTFESDLMYAHPDNRDALSGMLVASTYPLSNRTQAWTTSPEAPRLQFASSGAEGVYNAALALLGYQANWLMTDYTIPGGWKRFSVKTLKERSTIHQRPVLWIAAVGNGGLWPLKVYKPLMSELPNVWEQFAEDQGQKLADTTIERGSARSASLIWALFTLACAIQVVRYFAATRVAAHTAKWSAWLDAIASDLYRPRQHHRREQLAYVALCFGVLLVTYRFWSRSFFIRPEAIPLGLSPPLILLCMLGLAAVLIDVLAVALLERRPRWLRVARTLESAVVVSVPVLLTVGAPWLPGWEIFPLGDAVDELLRYERVTNLESQLSPMVPCLLVAAGWFLWGRGQLARLALIEQSVLDVLSGSDSRGSVLKAADDCATAVIERPWSRPLVVFIGLVWLVPCALLAVTFLPTFEGQRFDRVFQLAFLGASVGVMVAFAQSLALWRQIRRLLDRLAAHPLRDAFGRQEARLVERVRESLYAYAPTLVDLAFGVESLRRLKAAFGAPVQEALAKHLKLPDTAMTDLESALGRQLEAAEKQVTAAAKADHRLEEARFSGLAQGQLDEAARTITAAALTPAWNQGAAPPSADAVAWLKQAEDLVAAQNLTYIGYLFLHIRNLLSAATAGLVLLLLTIPSYPFQPQRLLNMFIWVMVLSAVVGVFTSLLQMNRSEVLSKLMGSKPNEVSFDRTLLSPMIKYGALPLFSLVATQFPGIGDTLFSWLEPALRALK